MDWNVPGTDIKLHYRCPPKGADASYTLSTLYVKEGMKGSTIEEAGTY